MINNYLNLRFNLLNLIDKVVNHYKIFSNISHKIISTIS